MSWLAFWGLQYSAHYSHASNLFLFSLQCLHLRGVGTENKIRWLGFASDLLLLRSQSSSDANIIMLGGCVRLPSSFGTEVLEKWRFEFIVSGLALKSNRSIFLSVKLATHSYDTERRRH